METIKDFRILISKSADGDFFISLWDKENDKDVKVAEWISKARDKSLDKFKIADTIEDMIIKALKK